MIKKKTPNKVVSQIEGNDEEDNSYQLRDNVLSCLFELQLLTDITKEKILMIEGRIKSLRLSIHGEDITKY